MVKTALYRHFDSQDRLLYVGISLDTIRRTQQHRLGARWFERIARIDIEWYPSRPAALTAEAIAIARESPECNLARPRGTPAEAVIPFAQSSNPVQVRGEALHPILWQGEQWAVTEYGIECRDGTYAIDGARLLRKRQGTNKYDWPLHLDEKVWVNMDDFRRVFAVACLLHHGVPIASHYQALKLA